jgi:hypothetical protein
LEKLTKDKNLLDEMKELADEDLEILQEIITEITESLTLSIDPEKILGKSVGQWEDRDFLLAQQLYGNSSVLKNLMITRAREKLISLEAKNEGI